MVEFQYSDKNYARSLVRLSNEWTIGQTELHADIYTEQDNKNLGQQWRYSGLTTSLFLLCSEFCATWQICPR